MIKLLFTSIALFVTMSSFAQLTPPKVNTEKVNENVTWTNKKVLDDSQIADVIKKDSSIQKQTISYLSENKSSSGLLKNISMNSKGDSSAIIDGIFKDKKLASMAIDYVKNNPELLEKALRLFKK